MIRKLLFASALAMGTFYFGQTVVFNEDFETPATRNLWTIGDRDGDTESWEYLDAAQNSVDSFQGYFATSFSWYFQAFTPDNTLASPAISLPASGNLSLTFKVAAGDEDLFDEHYAVYVIPSNSTFTGTESPVFEETLDAGYLAAAKVVNIDISSFRGQNVKLVFRHYNCTDIFYMGIDDVRITQNTLSVSESKSKQVKIFPNPSSDFINISNIDTIKVIRIFDMNGKLVKQTLSKEIDVKDFEKGIYIINIYNGDQIISRKFIKK